MLTRQPGMMARNAIWSAELAKSAARNGGGWTQMLEHRQIGQVPLTLGDIKPDVQ
jgi:hypothetical protein